MGRPPRAKTAAARQFNMRVTDDELNAWRRAAGKATGKDPSEANVSQWLIDLANRAAARG